MVDHCLFCCCRGRSLVRMAGTNCHWTGKKLVEVSVEWDSHLKTLSIQNLTSTAIGFQIQTYDEPKVYDFLPSKGVVMAKKQLDVEIKPKKKDGKLSFHLVAMAWCSANNNTFDSAVWKTLEAKKEPNQVIYYGDVPKYTGIVDPPPPVKKVTVSAQVKSKKMVTVEPSKLSYAAATGEGQTQKATIQNISGKPVAVKIQTNRRLLYAVKPGKCIIPKGKSAEITIDTKLTQKELDSDTEKHLMAFMAVPWPSESKDYDAVEFQKLEKDPKNVQKVLLDVEFGGKGSGTKSKTASEGKSSKESKGSKLGKKKKYTKRESLSKREDKKESKREELPATKGGMNTYVQIDPLNLSYQPPFINESATISIKNTQTSPVAYKMHTNKRNLYSVHPSKGIIKSSTTDKVWVDILGTTTTEQLFGNKEEAHCFQLTVLPWPKTSSGQFDNAKWADLEKTEHEAMQKIKLGVNFQKDSVPKEEDKQVKTKASPSAKKKKLSSGSGKEKEGDKKDTEQLHKGKEQRKGSKRTSKDTKQIDKEGMEDGAADKEPEKDEKPSEAPEQKKSNTAKKSSKSIRKAASAKEKGKKKPSKGPPLLVAAHPTTLSFKYPADDEDNEKVLTVINISQTAVAYKLLGDKRLKQLLNAEDNEGVIQPGKGTEISLNLRNSGDAENTIKKLKEPKFTLKAIAWTSDEFDKKVWTEKTKAFDAAMQFHSIAINVNLVKATKRKPTVEPESETSVEAPSRTQDASGSSEEESSNASTSDASGSSEQEVSTSEALGSSVQEVSTSEASGSNEQEVSTSDASGSSEHEVSTSDAVEEEADAAAKPKQEVFEIRTDGPGLATITPATPVSKPMTAKLTLANTSENTIAFKLPVNERFEAIPGSGLIHAGDNCKIAVHMKQASDLDTKTHHFAIAAVTWPEGVHDFNEETWTQQQDSKQTLQFKADFVENKAVM